jgi:hypothetical protein
MEFGDLYYKDMKSKNLYSADNDRLLIAAMDKVGFGNWKEL